MDGLGRHNLAISSGAITLVVDGIEGECSTLRGGVNSQDGVTS